MHKWPIILYTEVFLIARPKVRVIVGLWIWGINSSLTPTNPSPIIFGVIETLCCCSRPWAQKFTKIKVNMKMLEWLETSRRLTLQRNVILRTLIFETVLFAAALKIDVCLMRQRQHFLSYLCQTNILGIDFCLKQKSMRRAEHILGISIKNVF